MTAFAVICVPKYAQPANKLEQHRAKNTCMSCHLASLLKLRVDLGHHAQRRNERQSGQDLLQNHSLVAIPTFCVACCFDMIASWQTAAVKYTCVMPLRSMRKRLMVQLPVDSACSKPVVMICVDKCFAQSNCRSSHSQSACVDTAACAHYV